MSESPFVSVIVPAWNAGPTIGACLSALEAQTYPRERYEVLVVDNGGEDAPPLDVAAAPGNVRILREPRPGSYAARNLALAEARGAVLAFTDADAVPLPDWLERGVAALSAAPERTFVAGAVELTVAVAARPSAVELLETTLAPPFPQDRFVSRSSFGATVNLFVPRAVFARVGAFDARLKSGGDLEWGQRAARAAVAGVFAPDARVQHPARRTWSALARRARRLVGGAHDRACLSARVSWRTIVRETYLDLALTSDAWSRKSADPRGGTLRAAARRLPLSLLPFVWTHPRLRGAPAWDRLRVFATLVWWRVVRTAERLRLGLGGSSVR